MIRLITHAICMLLLTLAAASVIIFIALQVLPGDPAQVMLGTNARPDTLAALRAQIDLDRPLMIRYSQWILNFITGDLGVSQTYGVPVRELVMERLLVSLPLSVMALLLTLIIAIPVGTWAAARRGSWGDRIVVALAQIGIAIPNFWFAMVLVLVFSVTLRLLPAGGFAGWEVGFGAAFSGLILPAIALAIPQSAILMQIMRSALINTLDQDFIRTARAKGLTRAAVLRCHALRNALLPVLTVLGLQFSFLLAGTIIIENVFYLPGLGRLLFQAINQRDLIVVQSVAMLLVAGVIIINVLVNLAYRLVDPRLRRLA